MPFSPPSPTSAPATSELLGLPGSLPRLGGQILVVLRLFAEEFNLKGLIWEGRRGSPPPSGEAEAPSLLWGLVLAPRTVRFSPGDSETPGPSSALGTTEPQAGWQCWERGLEEAGAAADFRSLPSRVQLPHLTRRALLGSVVGWASPPPASPQCKAADAAPGSFPRAEPPGGFPLWKSPASCRSHGLVSGGGK